MDRNTSSVYCRPRNMNTIRCYTDGSSSGKVGPGGWGAILVYPNGKEVAISGEAQNVTNNQMELGAALKAITYVSKEILDSGGNPKDTLIQIISDSEYMVKGSTEWLQKWKKNNWKSSLGPVKNRPLWEVMADLITNLNIEFLWVKGHNSHPMNERVDKLANAAYKQAKQLDKDNNRSKVTT